MDTGTADSDLSYCSDEEDVFEDDAEELFDPVGDLLKKRVYAAYAGEELEALKQRERDLGFRKEVRKKTPNRLERFREWVWTTMTDPRSSALVRCRISLSLSLSPFSSCTSLSLSRAARTLWPHSLLLSVSACPSLSVCHYGPSCWGPGIPYWLERVCWCL